MQVKQEKPTQNIPQQVEEKNDKQVDNAEVRKDELDGQIVKVKGRSDEKVQINIFKNHKKTKKTLRIRRNISFQDFKKKINPSFTSKYFMIQIQWKKQGQFLSIDNEREFDQVMRDYKFQKINIKTLDEPYVEPARRKEVEEAKRKQTILDTKKNFADQLNSSIAKSSNEFQKIFPHVPPQKIQKFFTEMVTNAQKWMRNDLIYKYQPLKQKQQKLTLQKQCSECKSRFFGPYYVCLKCPLQYILCTECQFKYGFQELITHTNVNHTFAKIIDHKFTIKSVSIKTEDEEKPQGEFYPSFNNNPKKYQYKIQKKPESLEERLNPKRIIQEIDKTFRKEHEAQFKKQYAKNLLASLDRINFTEMKQPEVIPSVSLKQLIVGYQKFTNKSSEQLQNQKQTNPQDLRSYYFKELQCFNNLLIQNKQKEEQLAIENKQAQLQIKQASQLEIKQQSQNQTLAISQNEQGKIIQKQQNQEENQLVKKQDQNLPIKPVLTRDEKLFQFFEKSLKDEWQKIQKKKMQKQGENYRRPEQIYLKDLHFLQDKQRKALPQKEKDKKYEKLKKLDIPLQVLQGYMVDKYENYTYIQILEQIKKINEKIQMKRQFQVYQQRERRIYHREKAKSPSSEEEQDPEYENKMLQQIRTRDRKIQQQKTKKRQKQKKARQQSHKRYIKQI